MPARRRRNPHGKGNGANIPNKKEMWKAPVKDWIHDMYEKRQRKSEQKANFFALFQEEGEEN